jgi:hypothetical protein
VRIDWVILVSVWDLMMVKLMGEATGFAGLWFTVDWYCVGVMVVGIMVMAVGGLKAWPGWLE